MPAAPTNLKAARTANGIALSWDTVPHAIAYLVSRTSASATTTFPVVSEPSLLDATAARQQSYTYTVSAVGQSVSGQPSLAVVVPALPPPPFPPQFPSAQGGKRTVQLSWSFVSFEVRVFRSTVSGGPYAQVGSVPAGVVALLDTGLSDATTYFYVLEGFATDGVGGGFSAEVSARTAAAPPTNLSVKLVPFRAVLTVSWTAAPGADGYCVKTFPSAQCFGFPTTTSTSIDLGSFNAGPVDVRVSSLTFQSTGFGASAESDDAGPVTAVVPPPGPAFSILANGPGFDLSWSAVPGANSYAVLRSPPTLFFPDISTFTQVGTTAGTFLADEGPLDSWSQYWYAVAALDANGAAGQVFNQTPVFTKGLPDQRNLGAGASITATQAFSVHDVGQTFVVGEGGVLAAIEVSSTGGFGTLDIFNGPQLLLSQFIGVNSSGGPCCAPLQDGLPGTSSIILFPSASVPVSAGQVLRMRLSSGFFGIGFTVGTTDDEYAGGTFVSGGVPQAGRDLVFKTFVKPVAVPFAPPPVLFSFPGVRRVALAWPASPDATSYTVERADSPLGPFAPVGTTVQANLIDEALVPGSSFFYRVQASDASGATAMSDAFAAGPLAGDVDQANASDGSGGVLVAESSFSYGAQSVTIGRTGTLAALQFTAIAADGGTVGGVPATIVVRDDTGAMIDERNVTLNVEGTCGTPPCGPPALDASSPTLQTVTLSQARVVAGEVLHFEVHSVTPILLGDGPDLYPGGEESVNGVRIPGRDLAFQVLVQ